MLNPERVIECPKCHGHGEVGVAGTYGGTVSPEALQTVPCSLCEGQGEVAAKIVADYDRHVAETVEAFR